MIYKVSLTNKEKIYLSEADHKRLLENLTKDFVILNGEMFKPTMIVSITKAPDTDIKLVSGETKVEIAGRIIEKNGERVFMVEERKDLI